MLKLDLKVESLVLHLKHLIQSDRLWDVLNSPYRDSFFFGKRESILGISVTPEVHAIIKNAPKFIDNQDEKHDITQRKLPPTLRKIFLRGLGYWSEQVSESVHPDFIRVWETGAYKRSLGHPEYCK